MEPDDHIVQPFWVGFVPPELFRYKRKPKGGPILAFVCSIFILFSSTLVLGYVAYIGSLRYNTESKIETSDMSDNIWDCNMVKKSLFITMYFIYIVIAAFLLCIYDNLHPLKKKKRKKNTHTQE